MNFKELFIKLTEYTTPYGTESDLEPILSSIIKDLRKDPIGNYHKIIGNSETLFTCHLDNFCEKKEKVTHIIENNIIKTNGTTILGADNKAGVCVLLYLISNNVPGHYCFFIGEEPILSGGLYGSSLFSQAYKNITKYKRVISFDRKETYSIVRRQLAQDCCSLDFALELSSRFVENMIWFEPDASGYCTDSASFLEVIPECTNISVGVWDEHTNQECVDIDYVERVAVAASKIDWETLPVIRKPKYWLEIEEEVPEIVDNEIDVKLFEIIASALSSFNYLCMNKKPYSSNRVMIFNHWFRDHKLEVTVRNGRIKIFGYDVSYDLHEMPSIYKHELEEILSFIHNDMVEEID